MKHLSLAIFSALLILSSCIREEQPGLDIESKLITFSPSVNAPVQTKGAGFESFGSTKLVDESGDYTIPLSYYSTVDTTDIFSVTSPQDAPQTKGVKIAAISEISSFSVCAYDDNARFIPASGELEEFKFETVEHKEDGTWSIEGNDYEWKSNSARTFFGYANPAEGAIAPITQSKESVQFSYAVPKYAESHKDFLVGFFKGTPDDCKNSEHSGVYCQVPMAFQHALASVSFKKSPSLNGVGKITDIEISGIYKSGTVGIDDLGTITWTEQSFGDSFSVSESNNDGYTPATDNSIGESFFLIPQTEGEVKITVTIKDNGTESRKVTATLKPDWKAGHSYVYTFGEGFMPEICDNTSIKNTGTQSGYIRAAVIAYTVDGSDVVTGPATETPEIDPGWTPDGDFFVYETKLNPGDSTPVLVTNKGAVTSYGAKLKILVQASPEPFN